MSRDHRVLTGLGVTLTSIVMACAGPGAGGGRPVSSAASESPVEACGSLGDLELIDLRITGSEHVPAAGDTPAHCRVTGVIETEITFELLLPDEWNGRFLMGGGGGFVGSVQNQAMTPMYSAVGGTPLARGYATAGTDTGHVGAGIEAGWALDHPERQENWAHRAVHVTTEAAKSIIRHHYGRPADYAYFAGCSRGGGQGMMASQRYPDDFDGIVAGAPAYHWTAFTAGMVQTQQAMYPTGDLTQPVLSADTLALLGGAIDAACDTLDGVDDGILSDPRRCSFSVDDLPRCPGDVAGPDCVTAAQRAAIAAVYDGPTANGSSIFFGFPFGGEHDAGGWDTWVVDMDPSTGTAPPNLHYAFGTELYKHFIFGDPAWDYTAYDFSTWEEDTAEASAMLDATDTDLGSFRDRGGKIIYWTGWSDLALTPLGTIDYYERLTAADAAADDYTRLYLLPGVLHCGDGPGPDRVDWIEAIRGWVEEGVAPERLTARRLAAEDGAALMSRPVCPYPQEGVYRGGDPAVPESFVCEVPR